MQQVGSLFAKIGLDTSALQRGLKESRDQLAAAGQGLQNLGNDAAGVIPSYDRLSLATNKLNHTMLQLASAQKRLSAETDPGKQAALKVQIDNLAQSANRYEKEIKEAGEAQKKLADGSGTAASKLQKLVRGLQALGAVAVAAKIGKAAYELGVLGAQAERTEASFEMVVGGSRAAATMLDSLKTATRGTRSEVELMAGATNIMALGLADNAEDLGNIMRNVEALGSRFGGGMQQFQLMMSNDSLMRIDSFGIGVEEATERIEQFKAAGMDAGEAFDTAVLELMTEKFDSLGGAMEDNVTKIQRFKAAWADFTAELGKGVAGEVGGLNEIGSNVLSGMTDTMKLASKYGITMESVGGSVQAYGAALAEVAATEEQAAGRAAAHAEQQQQLGAAMRATQDDLLSLEDQLYSSIPVWEQYGEASEAVPLTMAEIRRTTEETTERVGNLRDAMGAGLTEGLEDAQESLVGLREEAGNLEGAIGELEGLSYRTPAQAEELASLQGQLGDVQGEIDGVISKAREMAGAFVLSALEAQISADGMWSQAETDLFAHVGQQLGMFDELAAGMISSTGGAVEALNSGAADVTEATNMIIEPMDKIVDRFTTVGESGAAAMGAIEGTTGAAAARMIDLGNEAVAAQGKIDAMHGMEITVGIRWDADPFPQMPNYSDPNRKGEGPKAMASGGQFWTQGPTPLMVGEGGESEFVSVIPESDMQAGGYGMGGGVGGGWTGDIIIQGAGNPEATADAVLRKLQDRGIIRAGGFR